MPVGTVMRLIVCVANVLSFGGQVTQGRQHNNNRQVSLKSAKHDSVSEDQKGQYSRVKTIPPMAMKNSATNAWNWIDFRPEDRP